MNTCPRQRAEGARSGPFLPNQDMKKRVNPSCGLARFLSAETASGYSGFRGVKVRRAHDIVAAVNINHFACNLFRPVPQEKAGRVPHISLRNVSHRRNRADITEALTKTAYAGRGKRLNRPPR